MCGDEKSFYFFEWPNETYFLNMPVFLPVQPFIVGLEYKQYSPGTFDMIWMQIPGNKRQLGVSKKQLREADGELRRLLQSVNDLRPKYWYMTSVTVCFIQDSNTNIKPIILTKPLVQRTLSSLQKTSAHSHASLFSSWTDLLGRQPPARRESHRVTCTLLHLDPIGLLML